jgi:hypothetical protein
MALYQPQIGNRGETRFGKEIANLNFSIPPLILVVFVENAFKHSAGSQAMNIDVDGSTGTGFGTGTIDFFVQEQLFQGLRLHWFRKGDWPGKCQETSGFAVSR